MASHRDSVVLLERTGKARDRIPSLLSVWILSRFCGLRRRSVLLLAEVLAGYLPFGLSMLPVDAEIPVEETVSTGDAPSSTPPALPRPMLVPKVAR